MYNNFILLRHKIFHRDLETNTDRKTDRNN